MKEYELFEIALKYIEKGYSRDNLRWGDDLYSATEEERDLTLEFYNEIQENGTKWANEYLLTLY